MTFKFCVLRHITLIKPPNYRDKIERTKVLEKESC